MNDLIKWSSRPMLPSIFDKIFDDFFPSSIVETFGSYPKIDVKENEENLTIKAELPGMTKEDISVELKDSILTISGEKKEEKSEKDTKFLRTEITYGSFGRSFHIPVEVEYEKIQAAFKDGILHITIPKSEKEKIHKIKLK
jgi:HSP20 family protein